MGESAYAIATGNLPNLAEQQLVDCDKATGNQGCSGGWPYEALTHYENNGACTEGSYTYTATDGSCKESSCTVGIPAGTVSGYQNIDTTNDALKTAVAKQPVSVCVKADSTFQSYRSGVLSKSCSGQINHAVIAVGYSGTDYFKIRNSWGSSWGEGGYIRLAQNDGSRGSIFFLGSFFLDDPFRLPSRTLAASVQRWHAFVKKKSLDKKKKFGKKKKKKKKKKS